jgi:drug/metabolite transporter (DMT)-like permease
MNFKITRPVAIIGLIFLTMTWGFQFPTFKALYQITSATVPNESKEFISLWISFYRSLFATLILCLIVGKKLFQTTRSEWKMALYFGITSSIGVWIQIYGMNYASASTAAFLVQFYGLFIPLSVALYKKSLPAKNVILAIPLMLTGAAILTGTNFQEFKFGRGEIATICAAVFFTLCILSLQIKEFKNNNPVRCTTLVQLIWTLTALPVGWFFGHTYTSVFRPPTTQEFVPLILIVIISTCMSNILQLTFQKHVSATEAGLIYGMEPVFATLFAFFLPAIYSSIYGIHYPNETFS